MKIAWLSSWPPRHCGIATYSAELVDALRKANCDVRVICHTDGGKPGEKKVYPVIDTSRVGWDEIVFATVKKIKPDIIHIQHEYGLYNTSGDFASMLFRPLFRWKVEGRIPVVITYHSVYTHLNRMIRSYIDVMQRIVDAGIVHAEYQWVHLPVNLGYTIDNVYIIPHGAKLGKYIKKEEAKEVLGLGGQKVIGMLGWFSPTKGFHRVLEMWDELSHKLGTNTVLLLGGDARQGDADQLSYKKELLDIIGKCRAKEGIKVVLGSFSPQEYERILAAFDAMIMPYYFASQSGNLAHAFSFGVPVVVSGIEGLKEEVEASGAGIVVLPDDEVALQRAIINIMDDDELRFRFSEKARNYVKEKINWDLTAKKHIRLYKKVIASKKSEERDTLTEVKLES